MKQTQQISFHSEPNSENVELVLKNGANIIDIASKLKEQLNSFQIDCLIRKLEAAN